MTKNSGGVRPPCFKFEREVQRVSHSLHHSPYACNCTRCIQSRPLTQVPGTQLLVPSPAASPRCTLTGSWSQEQRSDLNSDTLMWDMGALTLGLTSGPLWQALCTPKRMELLGSLAGLRCFKDIGDSLCLALGATRQHWQICPESSSLPSLTPQDIFMIFITW